MAESERCPTCGQRVQVETTGEGTSRFVPYSVEDGGYWEDRALAAEVRAERVEAALRDTRERLSTANECMRIYVQMRDAETPARAGWLEEEIAANDRLLASVPSSLDAPKEQSDG